jgi:hypothetical protein
VLADDGLDDGLAGSGSEGEDEAAARAASSGDEASDEEGPGTGANAQPTKSFLVGGKADTFARAFARIMDGAAPKGAADGAAPILAGSKSLAKRKAEDAEEAKADRAAKKLRHEMRQRGHVAPPRRGEDPAADAREKALQRTATRGVVRLFNAVSKAQRRLRDAEAATGSRGKAARLGKASFLAELRSAKAGGAGGEALVASARGQDAGAGGGEGSDGEGAAGWDVLKDGFTGLQGGNKMKDWDRRQEEAAAAPVGSDDDGGDSDGDW